MIASARTVCWLAFVCVYALAPAQGAPAGGAAQRAVTWLIFVDDLHLEFRHTGRIRDGLRTLASELIQEGDRFAVGSSGPSRLAVAPTMDREAFSAAIKATVGNGLRLADIVGPPNGAAEVRYRAHAALSAARMMLESAPDAGDGPKALLYISNGYSFELLPDSIAGARRLGRGFDVTRADVNQQLTALTSAAAGMGFPIFAIEPPLAWGDPTVTAPDPAWPAHRLEMRRVLRLIAEASGGFATGDGDFVSQLRRVAEAVRK